MSFRRRAYPPTNRQDRLQYTAPQLARSVIEIDGRRHKRERVNVNVCKRTVYGSAVKSPHTGRTTSIKSCHHSAFLQQLNWHSGAACSRTDSSSQSELSGCRVRVQFAWNLTLNSAQNRFITERNSSEIFSFQVSFHLNEQSGFRESSGG